MSKNSFIVWLSQFKILLFFLTGKILRFIFFVGFIYFLIKGTKSLAGYDSNQVIFFFLTFNLVDIVAQFLFREVYRFRPLVVSGDLDLILVKPANALFRVLMGGADLIDLITIPPLLYALYWVGSSFQPTFLPTLYYFLLILNSLLLATAFHIAVLALGIITFEIDHLIMIYRDLTNLGKLPLDIYKEPLRSVLTYLIPVGIMMTLPAKALMGLVGPVGVVSSFALGLVAIVVSIKLWHFALKRYTSASS